MPLKFDCNWRGSSIPRQIHSTSQARQSATELEESHLRSGNPVRISITGLHEILCNPVGWRSGGCGLKLQTSVKSECGPPVIEKFCGVPD